MIELYRTFVRKIKTKLNQPLIFPQFWLHNRIRGGKVSRIILRPAQHLNLSNVRRRKSHQKRRVYSLWAGDCLFPPLSLSGWKGFPEREGTARLVSGVFLKTNVRRVGFGETISLLPPHLVMHVYYSWRHPVSVAWLNQLFFFDTFAVDDFERAQQQMRKHRRCTIWPQGTNATAGHHIQSVRDRQVHFICWRWNMPTTLKFVFYIL